MPDVLRIVTFSSGGRPIEVLNLNSSPGAVTAYFRERGSFQFTPAPNTVQYSRRARRYGGGRAVGETHDNGSIGWTAYVRGLTLAAATQNVEALIVAITNSSRDRFVEWQPEGGLSSFMEIVGPGSWTPAYNPVEFVQTNAMRVVLTFPVAPLVRWISPGIGDAFDVDSTADWTFDALTSADISISGGQVNPVSASMASERRLRHTARGYDYLDGQVTMKFRVGATLSGYKAGVLLRATSALNYIEMYVDDTGTVSRLRIDTVVAGARTNRASSNLAARLTVNTTYWLRGRIEYVGGNHTIVCEHFTAQPGPMSSPSNSTSYALTGASAPLNTTAGKPGFSLTPIDSFAMVDDFEFAQYVMRDCTFPRTFVPLDSIPGTAPALADVTITNLAGTQAPVFALIGWSTRPLTAVSGHAPFNVICAASGTALEGVVSAASDVTNWAANGVGSALNGQTLQDATVSGAETYTAGFTMDPGTLPLDDFLADEITLEFWMRIQLSATVVDPIVVASVRSAEGVSFGAERFTNEWGAFGQSLVPSGFYQQTRLGTINVPANRSIRRTIKFFITLTTGTGSTGTVNLDHIIVLPTRQRCLSPSGKLLDTTYPSFISSTTQTVKTVRTDLSGMVASATGARMPDHGLGGSPIEPPPGAVNWLVKLSGQVPDDPVPQVASEQASNNGALRLDIIPRSFMLRTTP